MMSDPVLWEALPVPALVIAGDDTIADTNPAGEAFLNLPVRALRGAVLWDRVVITPSISEQVARARGGEASLFVNDVDVSNGERAPVQCNIQIAPLGGAGRMIVMISPREIANRMTMGNQQENAAKTAIGMAEMLAHEIKNPLAGITGAAQLLSMGLSGDDLELTDLIVAESRRIVSLLEQVEQFGNLQPPNLAPVNIHDVLDRARKSAAVGYGAHMQFIAEYDPSLPPALADADQLLQVVLNLLKNASQATQKAGTITLRTFYDAALRVRQRDGLQARVPLQIEVSDDGPGLPPKIADHVFEPFVSGRENGTGLGLALVSKLIGDVGGWIAVNSTPGSTVFRISLPVAAAKSDLGDV